MERAVCMQLMAYLTSNSLLPSRQSAYRRHHSVETALVRVYNDLLQSLDKQQEAVLILLDMTAAFDTVDHQILLSRLNNRFGVTGVALNWFSFYLSGREQRVLIQGTSSDPSPLLWGVPQGSVVGPVLFICYTTPVQDLIHAHGFSTMIYADDTQLYISMKSSNRDQMMGKLDTCLKEVRSWMGCNHLVLNDNKMEVLHVASQFRPCQELSPINIDSGQVTSSTSVRDLGVIIDKNLNMSRHINIVCRNASLALRRIGKIRSFLNKTTTETLIHAFVSSLLDNCNSLLYGIPDKDLSKLQRIQNSAARLIARSKKQNHITPILQELHWLPVNARIQYKVLLLTFNAVHGLSPHYISELITPYTPTRSLRSSSQLLLQVPPYRTKTYGKRTFAFSAPTLWNSLPATLRSQINPDLFKSHLKTHLFTKSYL